MIDQNGEVSTSRDEPNEVEHIDSRADRKAVWIIGIVFFTLFLLLTPLGLFSKIIPKEWHTGYFAITQIDSADDTGYYSYLRSAFFDGDIDFFNEKKYYYSNKITLTGYSHNHWAIGSAILWTPFFMVGHFVAHIYKWLGYPMDIDGYSFPYLVFTAIGAMFYVLWGLYLGYRLLRKFFSPFASLLSTITVFLSTPLPYYTFVQPHLSHAGEFFLVVLFVTLFFHWRENGKPTPAGFILGAASGMLFNIRNNSFIFFSIFLVELLCGKNAGGSATSPSNYLKNAWNILKPIGAGFFFTAFPQILAWYAIFGKPLPPTELYGSFFTNFINPHLLFFALPKLFFSTDWGLLFTQPVWLLGICGLLLFIRRDFILSSALLSAVILSLIVSASYNSVFNTQFAFGYRLLVSCNLLISFGFASFIDAFKRLSKTTWLLTACLFMFMNYLLMISYQIVFKWNQPDFALNTYENLAWYLFDMPQLFIRSTSFFRLILLGRQVFTDFYCWFFMAFFPAGFLCGILISTWIILSKTKRLLLQPKFFPHIIGLTFFMLAVLNLIAVRLQHPKLSPEINQRFEQGFVACLSNGQIDMAIENLETAKKFGMHPGLIDKWKGSILAGKIWSILKRKKGLLQTLNYELLKKVNLLYFAFFIDDKPADLYLSMFFGDLRNLVGLMWGPWKKVIVTSGAFDWKLEF